MAGVVWNKAARTIGKHTCKKWAKRKQERREGRWRFASNLASGKVEKDRAERIQQGSNSRGGVVTVPESKNSRKQNRKQRRAAIDLQVSRFAPADVFSVQKIDAFVPKVHLRQSLKTHQKRCRAKQRYICNFQADVLSARHP
jgi:hypothetical protein